MLILLIVLSAGRARGQDIGEALEWLEENGAGRHVAGLEPFLAEAPDHTALPMINSRDVVPGQPLALYDCDDAAVDGYATLRTNGKQRWALRLCKEQLFRRSSLPGYVEVGEERLPERVIAPWVKAASVETDIPPKVIDSIVRYRSGYRPGLISEQGHQGLMQLLPGVLDELGIPHGDLLDPRENLLAGARYLRYLVFRYRGLKTALAAFLNGPAVVEENGGKIPSDRRYIWFVREVLRLYRASVRPFPEELGAENIAVVWEWF